MGDKQGEARTDWRVRLTKFDEDSARMLAFNGGKYPQAEHWRLLRLALQEIDCLRDDLRSAGGVSGG